jgi:hypothetical protein
MYDLCSNPKSENAQPDSSSYPIAANIVDNVPQVPVAIAVRNNRAFSKPSYRDSSRGQMDNGQLRFVVRFGK